MPYTPYFRFNSIQQDFDVSGSGYQNNNRWLTDETSGLGMPVILNSGSAATITAFSSPNLTVGGLTGQGASSVGTLILLALAGDSGNNGVFAVNANTSATVNVLTDSSGHFPDPLSGSISWAQFNSGNAPVTGTVAGGVVDITGVANMTPNSVGHFLTMAGFTNAGNNGTFLIVTYTSATQVSVANAAAVTADTGTSWVERNPYVINDDLDFERTDRTAIKGVNYDQPVPSYQRPDTAGVNIPKNLTNIHPLDEKLLNVNRIFYSATVASTNTFITVTSAGNLKHATATDLTGVPCFDVAPYVGDYTSCFVEVTKTSTGEELYVLAGWHAGEKIYGLTEEGASTSPNTVEVHFFSVPVGGNPSASSTAYTWEAGQPTTINLVYGFGQRGDLLDLNCLRSTPALGIVSDAAIQHQIDNIYSYDGTSFGTTNLSALLTNTSNYFPFSFLGGGASDTVVAALNVLNSQIGNDTFTGSILTSGNTITQSLQNLSNAITSATLTRYIERLGADLPANTSHTLPGGATYVVDGTHNGKGLLVFWNGVLRDPGSVINGDDYAEASTTTITPYSKIKSGQHVNYMVL